MTMFVYILDCKLEAPTNVYLIMASTFNPLGPLGEPQKKSFDKLGLLDQPGGGGGG